MEADEANNRNPGRFADDPELRACFVAKFPAGPTPVQRAAWPLVRQNGHVLLIAPTGTGKTLASFLVPIDRMLLESAESKLCDHLKCVYVSPLKSLANDIRKNLTELIADVTRGKGLKQPPIRVGARTGDTTPSERAKLRKRLPHILLTTPESLSILLSQPFWNEAFETVETLIVDELHAFASKRRGADLALSLERLASRCLRDPQRIGLSATCSPAEKLARFLVGPNRSCGIVDTASPSAPASHGRLRLSVESLIAPDEYPYQPLVLQRIVDRLGPLGENDGTTVVFANTRPMTERITYLLRHEAEANGMTASVAAHHGSLDASVRIEVEESLKSGNLGIVVTSTSLELGVDFPSADFVVQIGSPGSVTRCIQRLGRSGHAPDRDRQGLILAAHAAELAIAVITADETLQGRIEPIDIPEEPLDVLCQHIVGQACSGPTDIDAFYKTIRQAWPFRNLSRDDFDTCVGYLCGELRGPAAAVSDEMETLRWTPPRIARENGRFHLRRHRVARWYRMNVGTIDSVESVPVEMEGRRVGSLDAAFADRLVPGDRFVLDGRSLQVRRFADGVILARVRPGESEIPVWSSQRNGLTEPLAGAIYRFREELASRSVLGGDDASDWLVNRYRMREADARCLVDLWSRQVAVSEIPTGSTCLVECFHEGAGWSYAVHVPLHRAASECLARAVAARIGRASKSDLILVVADFGFIVRTEADLLDQSKLRESFAVTDLEQDVIEGLDRGDLVARQFRQSAATGLMVLRNMDGNRPRVGGLDWVSRRLYPKLLETCPEHPLLRQARRDVLERVLDFPAVKRWLQGNPAFRFRRLDGISPFTAAWLDPFGRYSNEPMLFGSADDALQRLHDRLFQPSAEANQA